MARYIDADRIPFYVRDVGDRVSQYDIREIAFASEIKNIPTADVVPKSEVDLYRKQVDELEDELSSTYDKLENANTEVAREIFAEIDTMLNKIQPVYFVDAPLTNYRHIVNKIAKLKEKYTESEQ